MTTPFYVHLLPRLVPDEQLDGETVVLIDVLRATTTIVQALASGAEFVIPCRSVQDARLRAADLPGAVLCGERHGRAVEGFDVGNSPIEYTPELVRGRVLVFTTTNGTQAIARCRKARRLLLAAFTNLSAVRAAIDTEPRVHIVCAGTDGQVTREDALLAGALVAWPSGTAETSVGNDAARLCRDAWERLHAARLGEELRDTRGGRNLIEIGFDQDLEVAARIDSHRIVPVYDSARDQIRSA